MKLKLKKEVVNSVVYETKDEDAPVRSVYVMKSWLDANKKQPGYPMEINLEITFSG